MTNEPNQDLPEDELDENGKPIVPGRQGNRPRSPGKSEEAPGQNKPEPK
jgi:hypothetical protein